MKPYYEFYSDLDLLLRDLSAIMDKVHTWWINDEPFDGTDVLDKGDTSPEVWYDIYDKLQEVEDMLNGEPFFKTEE